MEVDESRGHLADQRVPPSSGNDTFHDDHHEASLDSAYEDNFDCGEEAMQRRLLITRILSSPLLFCASSSSSPKPTSSPITSSEPAHLQPLTPPSDEDTEDAPNSLEISTTETEEYDCPSSNESAAEPHRPPSPDGAAAVAAAEAEAAAGGRGNADDEEAQVTRTSRRPRRNRNNADNAPQKTSPPSDESKSLQISVRNVLEEIVDRIAAINDHEAAIASQDTDSVESECDRLSASDAPCLSWRTRRPMSGRSISTDSGISSVDDSRLSQSSSEYAASPATTTTTIDSSDEAQVQERSRRRSLRCEVEPPLKVLRATDTAKQCATTTTTVTTIITATVNASVTTATTTTTTTTTTTPMPTSDHCNCDEIGDKISDKNQSPLISLTAPSTNGTPALGFLQSKSVSPFAKPSIAAAVSSAAVKEVSCRWKACVFVTSKDNDLADHIADAHVGPQSDKGSFVCLWESCKVFNVPSTLKHWLEQHVVKHSRSKPLKCIVDGCLQRFSTKPLLEAHVNSHFEKNSKLKNEASLKSHQLLKLAKRKRLLRQNSKMQAGRKYDFFDACAMHHIKESLLHFAEMEQASSRTSNPSPPVSPPASVCSSSQNVEAAAELASSPNLATAPLRRSGRRKVALTDKLSEASASAAAAAAAAAFQTSAVAAEAAAVATAATATATAPVPTICTTSAVASSSDSGCSSLADKAVLESFVRALRTTRSGERQMLISYYNPQALEESEMRLT